MLIDGRQMHIQITKGDIGRYVILPGDPARCEKIAQYFDDPKQIAHNREYTLWTGSLDGVPVAVCSTGIGGPSAAIAMEELVECVRSMRSRMQQFFVVDGLKYLHKGGRISGGAKLAGTILNIKPILQGDEEGKIVLRSKVRGKSRAIEELANLYVQFCNDPTQTIGLAHADCPADMLRLHSLLREKGHTGEILTVCYEPVTGSHVGPGALALFFMGEAWR